MGGLGLKGESLIYIASKNQQKMRQNLKETFEWTVKSKWLIIQVERMEALLTGQLLDANVPEEWLRFPEELQQMVRLLNVNIVEFETIFDNFMDERYSDITKMLERESEVIRVMLEWDFFPSDPKCAEIAVTLKMARGKLEKALKEHLDSVEKKYSTFK